MKLLRFLIACFCLAAISSCGLLFDNGRGEEEAARLADSISAADAIARQEFEKQLSLLDSLDRVDSIRKAEAGK